MSAILDQLRNRNKKNFLVPVARECSACSVKGRHPECGECQGQKEYVTYSAVPDNIVAQILEHHKLIALATEYDAAAADTAWEEGHPIFKMAQQIDLLKDKVVAAVGWTYADACSIMDRGEDYRVTSVMDLIKRATKDLEL